MNKPVEERITELERQVKNLAQVTIALGTYVNHLIKKLDINAKELETALIEASVEHAKEQLVRSQEAGATKPDSGVIDTKLSDSAINGGIEGNVAHQPFEQKADSGIIESDSPSS